MQGLIDNFIHALNAHLPLQFQLKHFRVERNNALTKFCSYVIENEALKILISWQTYLLSLFCVDAVYSFSVCVHSAIQCTRFMHTHTHTHTQEGLIFVPFLIKIHFYLHVYDLLSYLLWHFLQRLVECIACVMLQYFKKLFVHVLDHIIARILFFYVDERQLRFYI